MPCRGSGLLILNVETCLREIPERSGVIIMDMSEDHVLNPGSVDTHELKRIGRFSQQRPSTAFRRLRAEPGIYHEQLVHRRATQTK